MKHKNNNEDPQFHKYEGGLKNGNISDHGKFTTRKFLIVEEEWQLSTPFSGQYKIACKKD